MTTKGTPEEMKAIFEPISDKYFTPEEKAALSRGKVRPSGHLGPLGGGYRRSEGADGERRSLFAPSARCRPALASARRRLHGRRSGRRRKVRAIWQEAMADPKAAPKLPLNPEVFAFISQSMAKLKEQEAR